MAILIFMFHSRIHILHCSYGVLNSFVDVGAIAMTGFFLLSGYVINLTYGRKDLAKPGEMKTFYMKRLITIIPLYFVWAFFRVIAHVIVSGKSAAIEELILFPIELLGIQSVFSSLFSFSHNGGSWFISCILICYFLYPLFQLVTQRISNRSRLVVILVLSFILLWSPLVQNYFHCQPIYSNPFFRALEFLIGIVVSQLNASHSPRKLIIFMRKPFICVLSTVVLLIGVSVARIIKVPENLPGDYMFYSWVALPCFISQMVSLGSYNLRRIQGLKIVKYMSDVSFCIFLGQILYVWYAVKYALDYIGCDANIVKILVSFTIVFTIANALHYLVEIPSSKYLKQTFIANR